MNCLGNVTKSLFNYEKFRYFQFDSVGSWMVIDFEYSSMEASY
jgi:hypothetical protein